MKEREVVSKYQKVDTRNDEMMVKEGLRVPPLTLDYSFKVKDAKEKAVLAKVKRIHGIRASSFPEKVPGLIGNAVVFIKKTATIYLKAPDKFGRTTISEKIYEYQLNDFIHQFDNVKKWSFI